MPAAGWMRRWRSARGGADEQARAPVLAAARGEPLGQLLNLGARALLSAAGADRAGLWLSGERKGESGIGSVTEAVPGPIPEEWKRLDVSTPFLRAALESSHPLHVELIAGGKAPHLGPLVGMHSAVWIPLRDRGRTFGLAMVGYSRPPGPLDLRALRARADEISLAVQHHRSSRRSELASEELRAQSRLSRAILCGVSADSILPQIARAARHYVQAEFVAVSRGSEPPLAGEGWNGAARWLAVLRQERLLQLWRSVLEEGRESEISGPALPDVPTASTEDSHAALDRVVAIPIEVRNATRGVLMAGLSRPDVSGEDFLRLESYALLAASALDREAAREERAAAVALLTESAPVVVAAAPEKQTGVSFLITSGAVDFVARTNDFLPLVAGMLDRRVRMAELAAGMVQFPKDERSGDFGEVLRHEVNNPLTGILGNTELLLARRDRLPPSAIERLETIAGLAVRLRETVRRLSNAWDEQQEHARSA
jgi:phospho-acceptor domain-containing protein/GAF domain-containing protein